MTKCTKESIGDDIDLQLRDTDGPADAVTEQRSIDPSPASRRFRAGKRRLAVAGLLIAVAAAAAGTHLFDRRSGTRMPTWTASCRDAIDATARLHRVQNAQLEQVMQATWAAVAGFRVDPAPVDASLEARLQRDADEAVARCTSPATPQS